MAGALFAMRLALPSHLGDRGLWLYGAWVLDVIDNGRWICQLNELGVVASKPPMYVWLAALATLAADRLSAVTLFLPSALATLGTACIIFLLGRGTWGAGAGLLAGLMYLLSYSGAAQVALARPDPVFAFTVTLAAFLAFRAWQLGRGWTWFWLAAAAATLTKGPLGVLFAAAGLFAAAWERWSGRPAAVRGSHAPGLTLFVGITAGWLVLAYLSLGQVVIDRMVVGELLGHAMGERGGGPPGREAYVQPIGVLWTFAPWSLLAVVALWRLWRTPAAEPGARRLERFLSLWFLTGLVVLSVAPHHDPRHLFPIIPPLALLAGRELAQRLPPLRRTTLVAGGAAVAAAMLALLALSFHLLQDDRTRVARTQEARDFARSIRAQVGAEFPLVHVDTPIALRLFLNTLTPVVSLREAAALLSGPDAVFVAVRDAGAVQGALDPGAAPLHEVARWPATGPPSLRVISNRARLEWADDMAALLPPLLVQLHGMRVVRRRGESFVLQAARPGGRAAFTNQDAAPRKLWVRVLGDRGPAATEQVLPAGARWETRPPG